MLETITQPFTQILFQLASELTTFIPKVTAALLVFALGILIAKTFKRVTIKALNKINISQIIDNTPIDYFLKNTNKNLNLEKLLGMIVYWLIMLIVLQTSISLLGLEPLSNILNKLLNYIPNIISAILVLFFGLMLSGTIESLIKASVKSLHATGARSLSKVGSYAVMAVAIMAAVSELGVASEFILISFVGLVAALSLGLGLALGLGGQDLVKKLLADFYKKNLK